MVGRPACLPQPGCSHRHALAVWLSFLGDPGAPVHLSPAGWGEAWAVSTDTRDLWAWSQVSHHPPSAAHYVFSKHGWSLWQEITIASKFRGKYLSIMPLGEQGQKDALGEGEGLPTPKPAWGL